MTIYPIRAFSDNYIWALHDANSNKVVVVDPGDANPVIEYVEHNNLELDSILITHYHNDHIGGVETLKQQYNCQVYGSSYDNLSFCDGLLEDSQSISLLNGQLNFDILHVPGHTLGHIAYYDAQNQILFCGDTLFKAGCGRMFEGQPQQFYQSLMKLAALPSTTKVYCTHEYTLSNLRFALHIEPNNQATQTTNKVCTELRSKDKVTLPSSIAEELATNPFLRCNIPSVQQRINQITARNDKQDFEIFASMRRLKDNF
ncbi:MAG: hydroxyacylglutathione hydrolase [Gammaproteobacteria bacterium]|nr:hydroxyacylglutathione hydrolase [Gammaproteobacteria bacterium]